MTLLTWTDCRRRRRRRRGQRIGDERRRGLRKLLRDRVAVRDRCLPVRGAAARGLDADVAESARGGRGRGRGRVYLHGTAPGLVTEPVGRRVVALRAGRVRGGVVEKAQVELVRGAGAERHVRGELVGRRRAAQPRGQRLVELEHVHRRRARATFTRRDGVPETAMSGDGRRSSHGGATERGRGGAAAAAGAAA